MPFSSGTFTYTTSGTPYVTGTTISSTVGNNVLTETATGLSSCWLKDGTQTATAGMNWGAFRQTNIGAATARTDAIQAAQVQDGGVTLIGSVAGTNTITGSLTPAITAYATGQIFAFVPANTNTASTTININSVGAKNIFWKGVACGGGELRQNVPAKIFYDGTQFHIIANGYSTPLLSSEFGTSSGTSIDITGIPAWAKMITINFAAVSTNGTSNLLVQIGDSGGVEATGYFASSSNVDTAVATDTYSTGFGIRSSDAANQIHGALVLAQQDANDFTWTAHGVLGLSNSATSIISAGYKPLSATLDRVRLTTVNGTDAFDAGAISILIA